MYRITTYILITLVITGCSTTETINDATSHLENRKTSSAAQATRSTNPEELRPTTKTCINSEWPICTEVPIYNPLPDRTRLKRSFKFSGIWADMYDSNLSPQQHAFCVANLNRRDFKSYDDWIVLINEVPVRYKGSVIGVVETKCSISDAIFPEKILLENFEVGTALYVTGDVLNHTLHVRKFVRVN